MNDKSLDSYISRMEKVLASKDFENNSLPDSVFTCIVRDHMAEYIELEFKNSKIICLYIKYI